MQISDPVASTARSAPGRRAGGAGLIAGLVLAAILLITAVVAPLVLQSQADALGARSQPPSPEHWLGTDALGHDMFARSLVATRLTLLMTAGATLIAVIGGVLLGGVVQLLPGRPRELALRAIDSLVAFPGLLLALVVAAILGASAPSAVVAIGVSGIPYFARLAANLAGSVLHRDYVETARLLGVPPLAVLRRHVLPNIAEPVLVLTASTFAASLTAISALSFVGLGVQSPAYDYGKLLNEALPSLLAGRAYQVVGPAALIVLAGVAAMLVGDGLAARADPRRSAPGRAAPMRPTELHAPGDALLHAENVVVSRADGVALVKGVSFSIGRGEMLGIVGESGSGKSLTALTVARLLPEGLEASARRLTLGEKDLLRRQLPAVMARAIALVYQDPGTTFNPALRMGAQLGQVLRAHFGRSRSEADSAVKEALEAVRVSDAPRRMRQRPHEWSGGMRQRAMLSSALTVTPELIIADEPTTALDVTVQREILRELRRVSIENGCALLFISHDIAVVRALCHRVLVMKDGEIVEELPAAHLDLEHARHPYTRSLLEANPAFDVARPEVSA
ncbi:dipeptide/oligopeptide/nickel ABC transporter permease/ATP-binding protein [Microbacterium sp. RURRCA19A]|uniref:dipeptide/oligopeptide/nickel ABC transporter permease/ATP-binding protein n=1 Tax=Microbacterium sp. RURRCA19A TaxID=1907391 RepID=UPI00095669B5|nr:dipeptide/oligopeptide/nickel ABC transporter permease/ATP-binding protein [Microbacterium sp. RURRCA19A]SIR98766.1 ABC-type dipeptide/oligopeptide/nickel transport system, ATPase component [Microbacterium sp. RURRCA19A]